MDGSAIGTYVAGIPLRSTLLIGTSISLYALDGLVVHAAHKRDRAMFISLALRAALPLIGGAAALLFAGDPSCTNGFFATSCVKADIILGANIAMLAAMAIDDAALSWERAPVRPSQPDEAGSIHLMPVLTATAGPDRRGTPLVGIAAVF